uniref:Uncharacterized protein n=1 Tax=Methanococcus maripaludis (strain C6 / ATCC BAA-1332) TaxID=444158 RepID=A9A749_METM6
MNTTWLLSVTIASIALYGLLNNTIKRNFRYLIDYVDYALIGLIWVTLFISFVKETVFIKTCEEIVLNICNCSENSFSTVSFVLGTFLAVIYTIKFNYSKIFRISGFIDSISTNYDKKEYVDVLTDLNIYFKSIEKTILHPGNQELIYQILNHDNYKNILGNLKEIKQRPNYYENKLVTFLDICLKNHEFVGLMGQIYPELSLELLRSDIKFNKKPYWDNYSYYLLVTQDTMFSEEIGLYKTSRIAYTHAGTVPTRLSFENTKLLKSLFIESQIRYGDILRGMKDALDHVLAIEKINKNDSKEYFWISKSADGVFENGLKFIELIYIYSLENNEILDRDLKYNALLDLFSKIEDEFGDGTEDYLKIHLEYLIALFNTYNRILVATQNAKNLANNAHEDEDLDTVSSIYFYFLKTYVRLLENKFLNADKNQEVMNKLEGIVLKSVENIASFKENRKTCMKKFATGIFAILDDGQKLELLKNRPSEEITNEELMGYFNTLRKTISKKESIN